MDNMEKMEKRIELEKRGRSAEEIKDLILDNCRATQISGLNDDFKNLQSLSLISVGLTTLKGFPNLPALRKLELSDNRLTNGLEVLHGSPNLHYLNLSGNKIKSIDALEPLKELKELRSLDLFNCEITNAEDYREQVFGKLKQLVFLDGYDQDNQEADDDDDDEEGDEEDDSSEGEGGDGVVDLDGKDEEDSEGADGLQDEEDDESVGKGTKRKHTDDEDVCS